MAENRLFQMLFFLLEKGNSTAPELAARFEVSVRTIYRDIDILSAAGIPVYTAQGKGGGVFIQESYVKLGFVYHRDSGLCIRQTTAQREPGFASGIFGLHVYRRMAGVINL